MAPSTPNKRYRIVSPNDIEAEVSADAAGIIACLFAYSQLAFSTNARELTDAYHRLHEFVGDQHPEAVSIYTVLD